MARYFNYFPKTNYSSANNSIITDNVTNIIARYAFENKLKENTSVYYEYNIQIHNVFRTLLFCTIL